MASAGQEFSNPPRECVQAFVDGCTECGLCITDCLVQKRKKSSARDLLWQVLADAETEEAKWFVTHCMLCGLCTFECPAGLSMPRAVTAARSLLLAKGVICLEPYQVVLVDRDVNFYSLHRDTFGIHYDDLKRERAETLFFPGCSLCTYSPELTRAAYGWLENQLGEIGFSEECCGYPLMETGALERAERYNAHLRKQFDRLHTRRVVSACPHCSEYLRETQCGMEVISLYELMNQRDFRVRSEYLLTLHDACPDRDAPSANATRQILKDSRVVEMPHHEACTLCCGLGGLVSITDPDLADEAARMRFSEVKQSGADLCVTTCMACAYHLNAGSGQSRFVHLLELAFGIRFDYAGAKTRSQAAWEGEWGAYNRARLAEAQVIC